ncbi:LytTR family DNA-binding domain-containing protein [Tateyamaria sp. SN6-1]|uniref:LytTR family DNA-binding domain-containing protein n=1 Tax=Tateyamaria sp. SN6-1 TaxID=3092148 RepID=UPI0039F5A973
MGFLMMSTGHPVTLPQFEQFWVRIAFWVIALFVYLLLSVPYGVAFDKVWARSVGGPIPLILLTGPLIIFASVVTVVGLASIFEPDRPLSSAITWQMLLRNLFVAHVFETVTLLWLLPAQRSRMAGQRSVTLAGKRLPIQNIGRVKAAEHYLEVHLPDGVEIIRERMSTFLDQVTPEDGVQTHRSHWIARDHAQTLKGSVLVLDCGKTVPVARGRQKEVQDWIDRFNPPHANGAGFFSPAQRS